MDSGPARHQGGPDDRAAFRIADGRRIHRMMLLGGLCVLINLDSEDSIGQSGGMVYLRRAE